MKKYFKFFSENWWGKFDTYQISLIPRLDLFWANNLCISFGWLNINLEIWIGKTVDDIKK